MAFTVDGRDVRPFGSRGLQRTVTLALKLAEVGSNVTSFLTLMDVSS